MSVIKFKGDARFKFRFDISEKWEAVNPVLYAGEIGVEQLSDGSRLIKIGDGEKPWTELDYVISDAYTPESLRAQSGKAVAEAISALRLELQNEFGGTLQAISDKLDDII